jgi:hypothetical protein
MRTQLHHRIDLAQPEACWTSPELLAIYVIEENIRRHFLAMSLSHCDPKPNTLRINPAVKVSSGHGSTEVDTGLDHGWPKLRVIAPTFVLQIKQRPAAAVAWATRLRCPSAAA